MKSRRSPSPFYPAHRKSIAPASVPNRMHNGSPSPNHTVLSHDKSSSPRQSYTQKTTERNRSLFSDVASLKRANSYTETSEEYLKRLQNE